MDMLVKLYDLPPLEPELEAQRAKGISVRRALSPEKHVILDWVSKHFSEPWRSEADTAFTHSPPTIFISTKAGKLTGFACYNTTAKGFFGPTGVQESERGQHTGRALLLIALHALRWEGHGYGIIGWVGPAEYYTKAVGATLIPESFPGIYADFLRYDNQDF